MADSVHHRSTSNKAEFYSVLSHASDHARKLMMLLASVADANPDVKEFQDAEASAHKMLNHCNKMFDVGVELIASGRLIPPDDEFVSLIPK